ncbi:MAG: hypothetical protein AB1714_00005 [Acidobacteriota bacterium]
MIHVDEKFNWGRVFLGGIVGGVAMAVLSFILNQPILSPTYESLLEEGIYTKVPHHPFVELNIVGLILFGIVLAWLYAIARHRLGRGPKTALLVGVVAGFIAVVPSSLHQAAWNPAPYLVRLWIYWLVGGWVKTIVGAFIAAAIYSEEEDEEGEEATVRV